MNASINAIAKRYRYTWKERDEESGLYYHGARYYIPWHCRWASPDPINSENYNLAKGYGLEKNMERDFLELIASPYEYCYDNPVRFNDPMGEQPPIKPGYSVGVRIGKGSSGLNYNVTGSIGVQTGTSNNNITVFISGSIYGGSQLGTPPQSDGFEFDLSVGAYGMLGKGTGPSHNFYTLNYNTPSPFKNTSDLSVSWGQMLTYNSAINKYNTTSDKSEYGPRVQTQGIIGIRLGGNFSLSYNNDATSFPTYAGLFRELLSIKATDAAWTGGIAINVAGVEAGYQNFSGYRIGEYPGNGVGAKYEQTDFHKSLNKASNFIRYNGMQIEVFSDAWLQNIIHNYISKESTYDYFFKGLNISSKLRTGD